MKIHRLVHHLGASSASGRGLMHLEIEGIRRTTLEHIWAKYILQTRLGEPLEITPLGEKHFAAYAPVYAYLPVEVVEKIFCYETDTPTPSGIELSEDALVEMVVNFASDHNAYRKSYGLYVEEALRRGWPCQPCALGGYQSVLLGVGRHARFITMNLHASVSPQLALAGTNKAFCRDLLHLHHLPMAKGYAVTTEDGGVERAREIGYPVVAKRVAGGNSEGVIPNIEDEAKLREALQRLLPGQRFVIVEKMVPGREFRIQFVRGKVYAAFEARPLTIVGDGEKCAAQLIAETHPRYYAALNGSEYNRSRLVQKLWDRGIRDVEDTVRWVPEAGEEVEVSAATGANMTAIDPDELLHPEDRARLEGLMTHHGEANGGMDLILPQPGARLEEGAILEVNCPCGFGFVEDPADVAKAEMDAVARQSPAFAQASGRVPVWFSVSDDAAGHEPVIAAFEAEHAGGVVMRADEETHTWLPLLNQPADAILICCTAQHVRDMGLPVNVEPRVFGVPTDDAELQAIVSNAGGKCAAGDSLTPNASAGA